MNSDRRFRTPWLWIGIGVLVLAPVSCCCLSWMGAVLSAAGSAADTVPPQAPVPAPSPVVPGNSGPERASLRDPAAEAPLVASNERWLPCPTFQRWRDAPELLPPWVPGTMYPSLQETFPPLALHSDGQLSLLYVLRNDRNRPDAIRVDRWNHGVRAEEGREVAIPASVRRALSWSYRASDAATGDGAIGLAIQAESTVAFIAIDAQRGRARGATVLPLPQRDRARPSRPRIAFGAGVFGIVVPIGHELAWYEVSSDARVERGPVMLNIRNDKPRVVWNGSRFTVLGSPEGEGDHTIELYEVDPGGDEPSRRTTIVRSFNPQHIFEQRRYNIRGEVVFEDGAYFMLVASWGASSRNPDRRFELFRVSLDGDLERRGCPDPSRDR